MMLETTPPHAAKNLCILVTSYLYSYYPSILAIFMYPMPILYSKQKTKEGTDPLFQEEPQKPNTSHTQPDPPPFICIDVFGLLEITRQGTLNLQLRSPSSLWSASCRVEGLCGEHLWGAVCKIPILELIRFQRSRISGQGRPYIGFIGAPSNL